MNLTDAAGAALSLLQRALGSVRSNGGVAVLAIGISAALWVVVSIEQNPPRTDVFNEGIPVRVVNVPPGLYVFGEVPLVRARVTAATDVWDRMTIRDFDATLDLGAASLGAGEYAPRVEVRDNRIRLVNSSPQTVPIRLEVSQSKVVPVRVAIQGSLPLGFSAEATVVNPGEVVIQGPRSLVEQVDYVGATIDLQDRKVDVNQAYPLVARNTQGYDIIGVAIAPPTATVRIPIRQQVFYRTVPVTAAIEGTPAPGFSLNGVSVEPATVTVVGNQADLEALTRVETRLVSVAGARGSITAVPQLALPRGVSLAGGQAVMVRIQIAAINGQRAFDLVPTILNQPPAQTQVKADRIRVVLAGPLANIDAIDAAQLRAIIDLAGLGPGDHGVRPRIVVPDTVRVATVTPETVAVTIE